MRATILIALVWSVGCGKKTAPAADSSEPTSEAPAVGSPGESYPQDTSAEGFRAFLAAALYRGERWTAETEAPREESSASSPHDRVQVWLNDVVLASQAAGNGQLQGTAHDPWSMAVKQMVDEDDEVVAIAAMLKLPGDDPDLWIYYCDGAEDRCGVAGPTDPLYAIGWDAECAYCHGGLIFNGL